MAPGRVYLYRQDYLATNPIDRVDRLEPGAGEPEARTRRPLTEEELSSLMTAARTFPLVSRGENKGGRPRKDGTPARPRKPVTLSDSYVAELTRRGRERELVYRLSLATGLRRGELSRVTVGMFRRERIVVPKRILKHRPKHATHVVIPLPPTLAADLAAFVAESGRLYEPSMRKVQYALSTGTDWRDLVRTQLDQLGQTEGTPKPLDSKAHDQKCMALAVEKFPTSVKAQEDFWREATGKSRASFFRAKKEYEARTGADQ